ncbi:MAG: lytic transglycosylase domain-containing protein [Thioalkalispiraceae bacterium]
MKRFRFQRGLLLSLVMLFAGSQPVLAAKFFVYQLPDGSRVISDRPIHKRTHKLVTSRRQVEGTGQLAAKRYKKRPKKLDKYETLIDEVAHRYSVDVALVKAVIHTESYFNNKATSHAGAAGLMQLMPATARLYGVSSRDIHDPMSNLEAGVKHLRYLLKKYPGNIKYALAAYNAGEKAVYYYNGVPPYKETRNYVQKVLHYRDYYRTIN